MSKLDGNERWKTKMLLTEHQEHYDNRGEQNYSNRPTPEEFTMIRDYVLLPHMLTMVQKCVDDIDNSSYLLKKLFVAASQEVMNRISKDLYEIRRELKRRNIKILNDEQVDTVLYYHFVCRGYQDRFGIVREVMRAEISVRFTKYLKEILDFIKASNKNEHK